VIEADDPRQGTETAEILHDGQIVEGDTALPADRGGYAHLQDVTDNLQNIRIACETLGHGPSLYIIDRH
jgi:hypothetical protein